MKRTARAPVYVFKVASRNGTEAADIKVRVLGLQRIERPFDQRNPSRQGVLALHQFQPAANPKIIKLRQHCGHVRMKVWLPIANSWIGQNETSHLLPDE